MNNLGIYLTIIILVNLTIYFIFQFYINSSNKKLAKLANNIVFISKSIIVFSFIYLTLNFFTQDVLSLSRIITSKFSTILPDFKQQFVLACMLYLYVFITFYLDIFYNKNMLSSEETITLILFRMIYLFFFVFSLIGSWYIIETNFILTNANNSLIPLFLNLFIIFFTIMFILYLFLVITGPKFNPLIFYSVFLFFAATYFCFFEINPISISDFVKLVHKCFLQIVSIDGKIYQNHVGLILVLSLISLFIRIFNFLLKQNNIDEKETLDKIKTQIVLYMHFNVMINIIFFIFFFNNITDYNDIIMHNFTVLSFISVLNFFFIFFFSLFTSPIKTYYFPLFFTCFFSYSFFLVFSGVPINQIITDLLVYAFIFSETVSPEAVQFCIGLIFSIIGVCFFYINKTFILNQVNLNETETEYKVLFQFSLFGIFLISIISSCMLLEAFLFTRYIHTIDVLICAFSAFYFLLPFFYIFTVKIYEFHPFFFISVYFYFSGMFIAVSAGYLPPEYHLAIFTCSCIFFSNFVRKKLE